MVSLYPKCLDGANSGGAIILIPWCLMYHVLFVILWLGLLPLTAQASGKIVLFDQAHGQKFTIDKGGRLDLTTLAHVFIEHKWTPRINDRPFTDATLHDVDAVVISGAFQTVAPAEVAVLKRFVERGGALCVMLHIGPPAAELLQAFGVAASNGVIREQGSTDFKVTKLTPHPLTRGIGRVAIYGGWALLNEAAQGVGIAATSPEAWVDLNGDKQFGAGDARQAFDVAVAGRHGAGRFAFFGDDAMFQNQFLRGDNAKLAGNLARWLKPAPADKGI